MKHFAHPASSHSSNRALVCQRALVTGIAILFAAGTQAANITWDANTATTGSQDGPGNWDTVANSWWDGAANVLFTSGDNVTFGSASGAAGIISVDAAGVTAGTLTLNNAGSGSYQFTGGSIMAGVVTKSGNLGVRFDNVNTFTSITASAGPYSQTDGAFRLNIEGALGTAPITFTNTANMTGLYFLSAFGAASTFPNDVAFTASTVTTRLVTTAGQNLPTGQIVTFSGLLTGGSATTIIQADNSASSGVSRIKLTNAGNTVRVNYWNINRGGIEFTSDAAFGDVENDLRLDVIANADPLGTGLIFGANSITLNPARSVTINSRTVVDTGAFTGSQIDGPVTFTGQMIRRGTTGLTLTAANTGAGGVSIVTGPNTQTAGSLIAGNDAAFGTGTITVGTGSMTALYNSGGNRTLGNAIALPATGTQTTRLLAANATTLTLFGIISGGSATEELLIDTDLSGGSTGVVKLTGANTFTARQIRVNRGGFAIASDAGFGATTNPVVMDIGTTTQVGLRFDGAISSARSLSLGNGKQVIDTNGNDVALTGIISNYLTSTTGVLFKAGAGSLTLSNVNTYTGGTTISAGPNTQASAAIIVADNAALSTGPVTIGTGNLTALFNSGGNRTLANNLTLPTTGTQTTRLLAANATTFELSGIVSGGSATEELLVDTNLSGGSTGVLKLSGVNTFTARQIRVNRGGLAITSDASLGDPANPLVVDIGTTAQVGLRFDAAMSSAHSVSLGAGKQVFDTNGNDVTLSGIIGNFGTATGELYKTGIGTLTISGANTYTGATTANNGTLVFATSETLTALNISDGATVILDGAPAPELGLGVSFTPAAVPEPGSAALALSGLLAMFGWRRRQA